jgi:hypothetical protein
MRILKTGDPCPCCGKPIPLTDPEDLRLLGELADMMRLPEQPAEKDTSSGAVAPPSPPGEGFEPGTGNLLDGIRCPRERNQRYDNW